MVQHSKTVAGICVLALSVLLVVSTVADAQSSEKVLTPPVATVFLQNVSPANLGLAAVLVKTQEFGAKVVLRAEATSSGAPLVPRVAGQSIARTAPAQAGGRADGVQLCGGRAGGCGLVVLAAWDAEGFGEVARAQGEAGRVGVQPQAERLAVQRDEREREPGRHAAPSRPAGGRLSMAYGAVAARTAIIET